MEAVAVRMGAGWSSGRCRACGIGPRVEPGIVPARLVPDRVRRERQLEQDILGRLHVVEADVEIALKARMRSTARGGCGSPVRPSRQRYRQRRRHTRPIDGLCGEGVHVRREPAFESGDRGVDVGSGRARFLVGADRIAHHHNGGFRLVFAEAGIAKALRGGTGVEGHRAHEATPSEFMAAPPPADLNCESTTLRTPEVWLRDDAGDGFRVLALDTGGVEHFHRRTVESQDVARPLVERHHRGRASKAGDVTPAEGLPVLALVMAVQALSHYLPD